MIANNKLRYGFAMLVIMLGVLFISGCGFHLRGQAVLPDVMAEPHLDGSDHELIRRLEEELRVRGARPVGDAAGASAVIELLRVAYLREVGTLDLRGRVTGYVLKYEVVYRVLDSDLEVLVDDTRITLSRNLDYDRGHVLQLEQDETLLRNELVDEVVRRIVTRLTTLSAKRPARIPAGVRWLYFATSFA
jgi:outer membrane lipopolysaccharide assembly protein LptE/RlpB